MKFNFFKNDLSNKGIQKIILRKKSFHTVHSFTSPQKIIETYCFYSKLMKN